MPSPPRATPYTLREASGASRDSTLMTSAPMSARYMPPVGPAMRWASSRTRRRRAAARAGQSWPPQPTTAFRPALGAAAPHERGGELGAQDEHDARVVREHAEADQGAQGTVDLVVDANAQ